MGHEAEALFGGCPSPPASSTGLQKERAEWLTMIIASSQSAGLCPLKVATEWHAAAG